MPPSTQPSPRPAPRAASLLPDQPRSGRRRVRADRLARVAVTAGGLTIIAAILGILIFIVVEVWPLTRPARVTISGPGSTLTSPALAILQDEHREQIAVLGGDGVLRVTRRDDGSMLLERPLLEGAGAPLSGTAPPGASAIAALWPDGRVAMALLTWETTFDQDRRVQVPVLGPPVVLDLGSAAASAVWTARLAADGTALAAALVNGDRVVIVRQARTVNPISGAVSESTSRHEVAAPPGLRHLLADQEQRALFGGTESGDLLLWHLDEGAPSDADVLPAGRAAITALTLLIGNRSLLVGQADGALSVWFEVRQPDGSFRLSRIRDLAPLGAGAVALAPSWRDKGFLSIDANGTLGLHHSTSERTLWLGPSGVAGAHLATFAPKADGALVAGSDRVVAVEIANPHPEISPRSLFGRVWYEGYEKPAFVWQSSSGSDDFEPKFSLTPLAVGTLKGTFYSLILAIPLGVFGAMYTSQFMHPSLQRLVKPTVEIMAALPSVVLGFLAGLWLAPRLERHFPALLLMVPVLPIAVWLAGFGWSRMPRGLRGRVPVGFEALLFIVVLALAATGCLGAGPTFEDRVFGGDFSGWLLGATGWAYDQRNAVVVGLAMGFAVIPIIFAIAEDAFSNVPRTLVSGSLALGANRWQTVTRVVLPTASPGIFSAIMIGFGRAVGETMIVLMATGNTPIMDWSPFNGFRTLSANIATEIPEAAHGGTLYRTLFLAALLLFLMTFIVNTAAELVRQRLRRRYAHL